MKPLPHLYSVSAIGSTSGSVGLLAAGLPPLETAAPSQFDGPGDQWSPESLFAAAVASCFVLTFRAVARTSRLQWTQLNCQVEAVLERVEGVTQFTRIIVHAKLTVPEATSSALCERLLENAEDSCLIANSLKATRELRMQIVQEAVVEPAGA